MNIARILKSNNEIVNIEVWDSLPDSDDTHKFVLDSEYRIGQTYVAGGTNTWTTGAIAAQWAKVREHRDELLKESDYTMLGDATYPGTKASWTTYRQSLRDITTQTDPFSIDWPIKPS